MVWTNYVLGLAVMLAAALVTWIISVRKRDVSIVDSIWSLLFLLGTVVYLSASDVGPRTLLVVTLVTVWAVRLSVHITWRNWGEGEDQRYQAMRRRHEPSFHLKSIYLVFTLQAVLAWFISLPLHAAVVGTAPLGLLDLAGGLLWLAGFGFETIADWQLARFRSQPNSHGAVLDRGLWRYSRHPNYFGECLVWWGFYLVATSAGGWWTALSPIVMTWLLLRVSGVVLLEKDIVNRRPAYRDYIARTSAFIPWPPRAARNQDQEVST